MEYPYSFLRSGDYVVDDILRPIPVETVQASPGTFPFNIVQHMWIQEGDNDGDEWKALGLLDNGNYFFYTAACDYTGFDCQGWMRLWVSSSLETLKEHAMTAEERIACAE